MYNNAKYTVYVFPDEGVNISKGQVRVECVEQIHVAVENIGEYRRMLGMKFYVTASEKADYKNPTQTLPELPQPSCDNPLCNGCSSCNKLSAWTSKYQSTVDDLLLKSNIHKCSTNRNKDGPQNKGHPQKDVLTTYGAAAKHASQG